jgi:malate synthase
MRTGLEIQAPHTLEDEARVLTEEALAFVADLALRFGPRVEALLERRRAHQTLFDRGERPDFLSETREVRAAAWTVAPLPKDLERRKVEITGPVERKMIINALNSGADVFMADFEDSLAPTWRNTIEGQANLQDAVRRTITFRAPETSKTYALNPNVATLMVRPRGWHLPEKHVRLGGRPIPAALFDFGLYFFHNARALLERGTGPYFYLPKMQSHLEARIWNEVFLAAEEKLELPIGSIKATCLIETLPAAFEMDEILYELRDHSAGLNCGRWDYIFSSIKTLKNDPRFVLPDRSQVTMTQPFLSAYTQLLIKTCHRRGAHAMGGMAAQIPIKNDPAANEAALEKVRADKLREVTDGHDGTWVAHPGLVPVARAVFEAHLKAPNQIARQRDDARVTREDLLRTPEGTRTEKGLRHNVDVGIQYLAAWLSGSGCVPIHNLMEDAATAEISRTQVWQWIRHGAELDDGREVTTELVHRIIREETEKLPKQGRVREAAELFARISTQRTYEEFLTLPAYELLLDEP